MGNETKNYKFPKPSEDDFYDISEYNQAMDMLDETLTGMNDRKLDSDGNASDVLTEFNQEVLRENIESGEKLSVSHGKIQKWFSEMKNIAFSGRASDATQDAAHRFVTDTEKDSWNAKVSALGGDISDTKIGSLETVTTEFPVPAEGETPKVFLGKVKKFIRDFNDFKVGIITVGKLVNNGQTTAAGYALDARYGKTLYDLCTQLNSNLSKIVYGTVTLGYVSGDYLMARVGLPDEIKNTEIYVAVFSVIGNNANYLKIYADKTESGFCKFVSTKSTTNYTSTDYIYINYVLAAI